MTDTNKDFLDFTGEGKPQISQGLKVITILTIIGSILELIGSVYGYFAAPGNYENTKKLLESGDLEKAPSWARGMVSESGLEFLRKLLDNRLPVMLIGLLGASLCLYGALEMRKLKKQGYILWLTGELLPIIGMVLLIGGSFYEGIRITGLIIPVVFIILYTVYRKDLKY